MKFLIVKMVGTGVELGTLRAILHRDIIHNDSW